MKLQQRKELLLRLGDYLNNPDEEWEYVKQRAFGENSWFTPEFIDLAVKNIATEYLQPSSLRLLVDNYQIPDVNAHPKKVGIVMAGNLPLVGFHDLLCVFLSHNIAWVKLSSKDTVLLKHLVKKMTEWNEELGQWIHFHDMLKKCDAYIATGSNNSSRYFDYYFKPYPSIIRRNRTSVALLEGTETAEELEKLADDVFQYFGLGCRNVTKLYVPEAYDFVPMLTSFKKYDYLIDHNKYKNNFDYNLAIHMLNRRFYMTNGTILLVEDDSPFSPISQLHYQYYTSQQEVRKELLQNDSIQCVVGKHAIAFGIAQRPGICDFADGVDTMQFLMSLNSA